MALEIAVGPPTLVLNQGHAVLVTEQDGTIRWPTNKGLYFFDTRLISRWRSTPTDEPWDLLNAGNITHYAARVFLTNRAIVTEDGPVPPHTLGLALGRSIGGGVHEDLDLVNYGTKAGALQSRDRDPQRLRRPVRGEGEACRASRPDRDRMV